MKSLVETVDLEEPLRPLAFDWAFTFIQILVCMRGVPLGIVQFGRGECDGVVSVERLRARIIRQFGWEMWVRSSAPIDRLAPRQHNEHHTAHDQLSESIPFTVAVCTKDRPESLRRCLQALGEVQYPSFEVVVVDNGSTDPAVAQIARSFRAQVRYVYEPVPGLNAARNAAIANAANDIVVFCDDDVTVSPRWLHGYAHAFRDADVAAVTGLVLPAELATRWQVEFERYGGMSKGFSPFDITLESLKPTELFTASRWGVGANMAFRRSVFERVGYFDPGLDVGTASRGAGDIEMMWRAVAGGFRLRYEPSAWVRHTHRRDRASLLNQVEANGTSYGCFLRTVAEREPGRVTEVRRHRRNWYRNWLVKRVLTTFRSRDRIGLALALAELRGALRSNQAYRQTRAVAPFTSRVELGPAIGPTHVAP